MSNPSMPSPSVTALEDPSCPEPELSRDFRLFESSLGQHLFVVDGSRIFDLDAATAKYFWVLLNDPKEGTTSKAVEVRSVFSMASGKPAIAPTPLSPPPLRSLSLNVAQSCNLGCKYCYADEGGFLGKAQ